MKNVNHSLTLHFPKSRYSESCRVSHFTRFIPRFLFQAEKKRRGKPEAFSTKLEEIFFIGRRVQNKHISCDCSSDSWISSNYMRQTGCWRRGWKWQLVTWRQRRRGDWIRCSRGEGWMGPHDWLWQTFKPPKRRQLSSFEGVMTWCYTCVITVFKCLNVLLNPESWIKLRIRDKAHIQRWISWATYHSAWFFFLWNKNTVVKRTEGSGTGEGINRSDCGTSWATWRLTQVSIIF